MPCSPPPLSLLHAKAESAVVPDTCAGAAKSCEQQQWVLLQLCVCEQANLDVLSLQGQQLGWVTKASDSV